MAVEPKLPLLKAAKTLCTCVQRWIWCYDEGTTSRTRRIMACTPRRRVGFAWINWIAGWWAWIIRRELGQVNDDSRPGPFTVSGRIMEYEKLFLLVEHSALARRDDWRLMWGLIWKCKFGRENKSRRELRITRSRSNPERVCKTNND